MLKEKQRLEKQIESVKQRLADCPEGKLICAQNGKHYKWYQSDGKARKYIPKKNRELAEKLAQKKYLTCFLKDLLQEKCAIDFYLRHHVSSMAKAGQLLEDPEYQKLLSPFFTPLIQELSAWQQSSYHRNENHPEYLTFKTVTGDYVRSKSEALIHMMLYTNRIPFRYECALQLADSFVYPDFTIRHPVTGEYYYWEHFGLMDQPAYCKSACSKLHLYSSNGIIPTIQLITTYETKEHPLSPDTIERLIRQYFM